MICPRFLAMQHRMIDLDPFERKILRELQRDASLTTAEIAERVGLTPSPCWRRIYLSSTSEYWPMIHRL